MMLSALLLAASAQVYGTDIPEQFRNPNWNAYIRCVRSEVNEADQPARVPDGEPTIASFAALMAHCGAERSRTIADLRGFIRGRHPDWAAERIEQAAEFVLTGQELRLLLLRRFPQCAVHDMPCEEF